jgi:hypothetical protein
MGKPVTIYQKGATQSMPVIDYAHQTVHEGRYFTADHYVSVGTATAVTVLVVPPAAGSGRYCHMTVGVFANGAGVFQLSEDPVTTVGSTLVAYNNNRPQRVNFPNPVSMSHTVAVNAASVGTVLETIIVASSGTNMKSAGNSGNQRTEWILDGTYRYLARFVADNAATRVNLSLSYYYEDH